MSGYEEFIILASAKPSLKKRIQEIIDENEEDEAAFQYNLIALAEQYGYTLSPKDFSVADVIADSECFDEDSLELSDRGIDYEKMYNEYDDDEEDEDRY